ncbi:MAG: riboflavin synthase [Pseudobdellovibrionaceae bacterium]
MFSGIVESCQPVVRQHSEEFLNNQGQVLRLTIAKPTMFTDLSIGDSICCNGVCLTIESFSESEMQFALGAETLKVLNYSLADMQNNKKFPWTVVNLERSLRFGDRIHGHLVAGHVEAVVPVTDISSWQEGSQVWVQLPDQIKPYVWKKGSITLNGVSLTVNEIDDKTLSVCLIPETLKRTNLQHLQKNDFVTIESDYFSKAAVQSMQNIKGNKDEI